MLNKIVTQDGNRLYFDLLVRLIVRVSSSTCSSWLIKCTGLKVGSYHIVYLVLSGRKIAVKY